MKRRRFVKLMMSKGLTRNEANYLAYRIRTYNGVGLSYNYASSCIVSKTASGITWMAVQPLEKSYFEAYWAKRKALTKKEDAKNFPGLSGYELQQAKMEAMYNGSNT